jgi:hypothetical protein
MKIFSERFLLKDSILKDSGCNTNIFWKILSERFHSERFQFGKKSILKDSILKGSINPFIHENIDSGNYLQ